ncbi:hemagglutinin [Mycoplasmopsis synoviae]|uniref:Hemagglutinin n=1 Tax=Mycoplasmopsis synoviae TaxID=2109 RepID=A0AAX3F1G6_MYCSY|nr:hemagglutinin [Mycoplasmopsis synoviae]UBM43876.1 hemagglutinin [Mycoplasmopsis synoviae]UZW64006.1 hemagglutinin [Mycoplasmopsis synoviae]UZW64714.1 hemagglutinin [Mycoplasmopsis synoviae]
MPRIVLSPLPEEVARANKEYDASIRQGGVVFWKTRNGEILDVWFAANQDKFTLVADQLTRKLGEEKFKNMTLSNPTISWDEVKFSKGNVTKLYLTPKVTFNLAAKEGYEKATDSLEKVTLTIRNLYKEANPDTNVFATQGTASSSVSEV